MNKVLKPVTHSFRQKGSKFIGHLYAVADKQGFDEKLDARKAKYPDATHHCYAWRINPANIKEFAQNDGEPGGTAGLPILNQLKSFEVVNAAIIVVRYYGGTNLGKSRLIDAYGRSAELCLQKAVLREITLIQKVRVTYPYSEQNLIEKLGHRFNLKELASEYLQNVTLTVGCPQENSQKFINEVDQVAHLGIKHEVLEKSYL